MAALNTSAIVSVAAQNAGNEFVHPIGNTSVEAVKGSLSIAVGKVTDNRGISPTFRPRL